MRTKTIIRMTAFGLAAAAALTGVIFLTSDSAQAQVIRPGATFVRPAIIQPRLPIVAPRPFLAPRPAIFPRPFFNPFIPRFPFFRPNPFLFEENPFFFNEEIGVGVGEVD